MASTMTIQTNPTHVGGTQGCCWLGTKPHTGAATLISNSYKQCCSPAMTKTNHTLATWQVTKTKQRR